MLSSSRWRARRFGGSAAPTPRSSPASFSSSWVRAAGSRSPCPAGAPLGSSGSSEGKACAFATASGRRAVVPASHLVDRVEDVEDLVDLIGGDVAELEEDLAELFLHAPVDFAPRLDRQGLVELLGCDEALLERDLAEEFVTVLHWTPSHKIGCRVPPRG